MKWSSCPRNEPSRRAANVIRMQPGPTWLAVTHVQDIMSSFEFFIPDFIQKIILDCTNLEGRHVFEERLKEMVQTTPRLPFVTYSRCSFLLWGSYPCGVFRSTEGIHKIPVGCKNRQRTFPCNHVSGKLSTKFPGLSVSITETTDQLDGRETSYLSSGYCGMSGCTASPCFRTLGLMSPLMSS